MSFFEFSHIDLKRTNLFKHTLVSFLVSQIRTTLLQSLDIRFDLFEILSSSRQKRLTLCKQSHLLSAVFSEFFEVCADPSNLVIECLVQVYHEIHLFLSQILDSFLLVCIEDFEIRNLSFKLRNHC